VEGQDDRSSSTETGGERGAAATPTAPAGRSTGDSPPPEHAGSTSAAGDGHDDGDSSIDAGAVLPALDERELSNLRALGRRWEDRVPPREEWERALPVDPRLEYSERHGPARRGGRFVPILTGRPDHPEDLEATPEAIAEPSDVGRLTYLARRVLIGAPLRSTAVAEERMRKLIALPVLSSDALSSVAYGPEAMLAVLALAGVGALKLSLPIGGAIALLMLSVGLGYRQVIRAYPHGGGSYIVASREISRQAGLLAGAGLIVDYTLTVAVSVASGVAAVTSAMPSLTPATVPIGLGVIALLVAGNLRGVRAAGAIFSGPTYLFVFAIALVVIVGLVDAGSRGFHPMPAHVAHAAQAVTVLLVLRAFSSGATAMTGIEAISNSVPAFRAPEADNARKTLSVMVTLLILMFAGIVGLAYLDGAAPGGTQTLLSQLAHRSVGGGVFYGYVQAATALVLLLAANTAFNGFPRLLFFMAKDGYVPHMFLRLGDRLAFTSGIVVLALVAALVFLAFGGDTNALIPLYAVGVFLAFTLSQSGMVLHWRRHREPHWRKAAAINGAGAVLSALVLVITATTKFTAGAWVVLILVPALVVGCHRVHRHYVLARRALRPQPDEDLAAAEDCFDDEEAGRLRSRGGPAHVGNLMVVAIAAIDRAALRALSYAASLEQPLLALHVSPSQDEAERFHRYWREWGDHLPLEVVVSPYRATVAPLANYLSALHRQRPQLMLTVIVPEIIPRRSWQKLLHSSTARRLRRTLIHHERIVITSVPFRLPA
jgi:amino acid transporter